MSLMSPHLDVGLRCDSRLGDHGGILRLMVTLGMNLLLVLVLLISTLQELPI